MKEELAEILDTLDTLKDMRCNGSSVFEEKKVNKAVSYAIKSIKTLEAIEAEIKNIGDFKALEIIRRRMDSAKLINKLDKIACAMRATGKKEISINGASLDLGTINAVMDNLETLVKIQDMKKECLEKDLDWKVSDSASAFYKIVNLVD